MDTLQKSISGLSLVSGGQSRRLTRISRAGVFCAIMFLTIFTGIHQAFGQGVGISETTITPHESAILELRSVARGFLVPRMDISQRDAISNPTAGLVIYNTETNKLNMYNGSFWRSVFSGSNGINNIFGTTNRITIDNTDPANPEIDIANTYVGQGSITTLGIVTTGTWNATPVGVQYGGTGLSSIEANNLIYGNGTGAVSLLAPSATSGSILMNTAGGPPSWTTLDGLPGSAGILPIANGGTNSGAPLNNNRVMISSGGAIIEAGAMGNGQILVGQDAGVPQSLLMSGDATLDELGDLTISDGAITSAKILDGSISIDDIGTDAVGASEISTGAVTSDEILDGTIAAIDIGTGEVTTTEILDGTIASEDIGTGEVTTTEILDGTIASSDIGDGAVTTTEILDGTIATVDIGTGAVTTTAILDGTIAAADIGVGAVTTSEILDGTVSDGDLNKANIPLSGFGAATAPVDLGSQPINDLADPTLAQDAATKNYVDNALGSADDLLEGNILVGDALGEQSAVDASGDGFMLVGDGTTLKSVDITGDIDINSGGVSDIQADAVGATEIATDAVGASEISTGAVTSDEILDGTIASSDIGDGAVTTTEILDGTIAAVDIGTGAVTTTAILDGTIAAADIGVGAVTTTEILDGTVSDGDLNKANIPLSGFGAATSAIDLGSQPINSLADPTQAQDAATKNYVDNALGSADELLEGNIIVGDVSNEHSAVDASGDGFMLIGDGTTLHSVDITGDIDIDNSGITDIQANAVGANEIANDAVGSSEIQNSSITNLDIADNAITETKIVDDAITNRKIAERAVARDNLVIETEDPSSVYSTDGSGNPIMLPQSDFVMGVATVAEGGTGQTSAGNAGDVLRSDGSNFVPMAVNPSQRTLTGPFSTNLTNTIQMMGLGSSSQITPNSSGIILVIISGDILNTNNTNATNRVQLRYGEAPVPAYQSPESGLQAGGEVRLQTSNFTDNLAFPFTLNAIISGLTVGTAYWIDIAHQTDGGTSTLSNLSISIIEL